MDFILEQVRLQALAELPQIENKEAREEALREYINNMTNYELLELISRATER